MTAGDEEAENLVDNLFREVDDQFQDLEREYHQAREDFAMADGDHPVTPSDALEAANERFELMSRVATLEAEISRQADELDERDRLLSELGDKIAGFEADIAERDAMLTDLHAAKQEVLDERREQARLSALLDARAAERQELADVAQRLQNERDHVQELLETSLARFDEVEAIRVQMDDKLRHLEAARDTAAHEHDARAHELIESRAEMSKLADKLDEYRRQAEAADQRAEKAEALAERRANEAGYLNRRIDAMNDKLNAATQFEAEATNLRRELQVVERRNSEIDRELDTSRAEASAAQAAVEAIAERTADYDELVATVSRLEEERDAAWEAASGYTDTAEPVVADPAPATEETVGIGSLADRARELGARRANEAELAAQAAEDAAAEAIGDIAPAADPEPELHDLDDDDLDVIEAHLASLDVDAPIEAEAVTVSGVDPAPVVEFDGTDVVVPRIEMPTLELPGQAAAKLHDTAEIPAVVVPAAEAPPVEVPEVEEPEPVHVPVIPSITTGAPAMRKRAVLPADLVPNTPDAVAFLLNQPGVTAIVDARSTCGRTGIRPSELFERMQQLRDHFDVPVEVVVTPVSTPVGGAPDLPAIGVHHVTGADTVADRIRALCMGLPADQPLVVIAGDDHVRRAAIGEEANVIEPSAVLNLAAD